MHPSPDVETQKAHNVFGTVTQTVSKSTVVQVGYEGGRVTGYQSNPFLRTVVGGIRMVGNHPTLRNRNSVSAR
ncbi:MAG: DUF3570 domain-containing protein, partial [Synechococcaceae bacterium WB8_3_299]|nr:DUF3570 domain-containing protein [Synechococcaceae bacterium WB8_3_299]